VFKGLKDAVRSCINKKTVQDRLPEPVQDILGPLAQPDLGLLNIRRTELWAHTVYKISVLPVEAK